MLFTRSHTIALLAAACGSFAPALASAQHHAQGETPPAKDPAALFASSCSACHLPPDPEREMDRAWLNQIRDTA